MDLTLFWTDTFLDGNASIGIGEDRAVSVSPGV
jgi:hypothetical protein